MVPIPVSAFEMYQREKSAKKKAKKKNKNKNKNQLEIAPAAAEEIRKAFGKKGAKTLKENGSQDTDRSTPHLHELNELVQGFYICDLPHVTTIPILQISDPVFIIFPSGSASKAVH